MNFWKSLIILSIAVTSITPAVAQNDQIKFKEFLLLSSEVEKYRSERLVSVGKFLEMAREENTIILDTRSKSAFDRVHIKGAVHLNFSDFTAEKLAKIIPHKSTRILIYCNNNFTGEKRELKTAYLVSKSPALALNIPTFINLFGYGYKNLYELGTIETLSRTEIPLQGIHVGDAGKLVTR